MDLIKSQRIEAALARALATGETAELFEWLRRSSGLPGPRPNLDLARAVGTAVASAGKTGAPLARALVQSGDEYLVIVGAMCEGARLAQKVDADRALAALHELAGDERFLVRDGVVHALRTALAARGDEVVRALASFTDGYLHAHVALEALAEPTLLTSLHAEAEVLARLDEAFELADASPRAAERTQGLRTLRRGLPAQIRALASRFSDVLRWLEERTRASRPETREVVAEAIRSLRRSSLPQADADRLARALDASAPPARDAARIVQGTRKRSKGRR